MNLNIIWIKHKNIALIVVIIVKITFAFQMIQTVAVNKIAVNVLQNLTVSPV